MKECIDWLMEADVHFILTHVHQGCVGKTERWNIPEIYMNVDRLSDHLGYPMKKHLKCPAFTQDKFAYILALGDLANPSIKIEYPERRMGFLKQTVNELDTFFNDQLRRGYKSFIIKRGYVTNHKINKGLTTVSEILKEIDRQASNKYIFGYYPYVIVQVEMENWHEVKVVCFGGIGKYVYLAVRANNLCVPEKLKEEKYDALLEFATSAINRLKETCPAFISDGLVRVDIFCDNFGNLKVNEIESLEACYHSKKTSPSTGEIEVQRLMPEYWNHQLKELVNAAFHFNFNRGIYDNIIEENAQDDSPEPPAKRKKKNNK